MPYMLVRHTVEDFDRWKKILDESRAGQHEQPGRKSAMAFRNADNPNETLVLVEFESLEQARQFTQSPELPARRKRAGLVGPPEILFLDAI